MKVVVQGKAYTKFARKSVVASGNEVPEPMSQWPSVQRKLQAAGFSEKEAIAIANSRYENLKSVALRTE